MKLGILFSSIAALIFLGSCKQEIDLIGDAKETAVVYGLLNQAEDVHFIKINRAFLSNGNSLVTAQIPDSNYFNNVQATVKEVINGSVTRTWILDDTLIENKESGVFFAPEQKVYFFRTNSAQPLIANQNTEYKLDININEGEFVISGKTKLVSGISIQTPSQLSAYTFAPLDVSTNGYSRSPIKLNPGDAQIMDVKLKVRFDEFIGSASTTKSFEWTAVSLGPDELASNVVNTSANGQTFYTMIKQNATDNPAITKRKIKDITISCTGGAADLQSYITINKPSSSLAQNKPTYTNLTASNDRKVVGLFSARSTVSITKADWSQSGSNYFRAIDQNSMKELAQGTITGTLLFCTSNPLYNPAGPTPQPYFCN